MDQTDRLELAAALAERLEGVLAELEVERPDYGVLSIFAGALRRTLEAPPQFWARLLPSWRAAFLALEERGGFAVLTESEGRGGPEN